jgi:hypothetical protein
MNTIGEEANGDPVFDGHPKATTCKTEMSNRVVGPNLGSRRTDRGRSIPSHAMRASPPIFPEILNGTLL